MAFEVSKDFIATIRQAIESGDNRAIVEEFSQLHPADIAEIFRSLETEEALAVYFKLDAEKAAEVLLEMGEERRMRFMSHMSPHQIAHEVIDNLESDDAADLIGELSEIRREEVIALIEDEEQASDIVDLLNYEEGTAGALMAKEMIKVKANWSVAQCIGEVRKQAELVTQVYSVYVVDDKEKLLGIIPLKSLLSARDSEKVESLYKKDIVSVKVTTSQEDVANDMKKYDLVAMPVKDELGRLVGRITIDDVVDFMQEEAEKDYQMASGMSEVVESSDNTWVMTRARLPWLIVGLLGGVLGAQVIGQYEDQIQLHPEMAFFIPLIAAMGGNVGVQSSALIVQGLANNTLIPDTIWKKVVKELGIAMINGLVCAGLILVYNVIFGNSMDLGLTVSVSLLAVILFAGLFGTLIPLLLDKYKIDPALATGPFITTVNDVFGLFLYFFIGHLMY